MCDRFWSIKFIALWAMRYGQIIWFGLKIKLLASTFCNPKTKNGREWPDLTRTERLFLFIYPKINLQTSAEVGHGENGKCEPKCSCVFHNHESAKKSRQEREDPTSQGSYWTMSLPQTKRLRRDGSGKRQTDREYWGRNGKRTWRNYEDLTRKK